MIVFNLRCAKAHVFEAWFRDSATFEAQNAAGEVACPACGNSKVVKAPMAPNISPSKATGGGKDTDKGRDGDLAVAQQVRAALQDIRQQVEKNADYVGDKFAEEARKIHYGETDKRNIYGEASNEEAKSLKDEGVEFGRIPWLSREDA